MKEQSAVQWAEIGFLELGVSTVFIRLYDRPDRLTMPRDRFIHLLKRIADDVTVFSNDPTQCTLFGDTPDTYAGKAELTRSEKAVRVVLKDKMVFYINRKRAFDFAENRCDKCGVSALGDVS